MYRLLNGVVQHSVLVVRPDGDPSCLLTTQAPVEIQGYKIETEPLETFTCESIKDQWSPRRQWPARKLSIDGLRTSTPSATFTPTSEADKWKKLLTLQQEQSKLLLDLGKPKATSSEETFVKGSLQCPVCKANFSTSYRAKNHHRLVHLKASPWTCAICSKQCSSQKTLENHITNFHVTKNFHCNLCQGNFTNKGDLSEHMLTHNRYVKAADNTVCQHCLQIYKDLYGHLRTCRHKYGKEKETMEKFPCRIKGCHSQFNLLKHRNWHEKEHCKHNPNSTYNKKQRGELPQKKAKK